MLKHGSSVGVLARSGVRPVARTRNASTRAVRPDPAPSLRHPAFQDLEDRLGRLPCFRARAHDCVKVLYEPQEFYQSLLVSVHLALSPHSTFAFLTSRPASCSARSGMRNRGFSSRASTSARRRKSSFVPCLSPLSGSGRKYNPNLAILGIDAPRRAAKKPTTRAHILDRLFPVDAREPKSLFGIPSRIARRSLPRPGRPETVSHSGSVWMEREDCSKPVQRGMGTSAHEGVRV